MNAQGMIVWDLEGMQYPRINYVGDPRMLSVLAPEMEYNGAVDAYFKKFRDAGLRVGVTVRPQRLRLTTRGGGRRGCQSTLYPGRPNRLAHTRWGATLFYIDSNVSSPPFTMPPSCKQLQEMFPDVLLIPEWKHPLLCLWRPLSGRFAWVSFQRRILRSRPTRTHSPRLTPAWAILPPTMMPWSARCAEEISVFPRLVQ